MVPVLIMYLSTPINPTVFPAGMLASDSIFLLIIATVLEMLASK